MANASVAPPMSDDPGFLARWSRKKRNILVEPEAAPLLPEPAAAAPLVEAEPPFDVASLPPINLLDAASDFSAFLKPGVPAALRSAALRKAWVMDPLIKNYLSPLDYGWDFNTPGGLPLGFSATLGEGADALGKLLRQAIGEPESKPEGEEETAPEATPAEPETLLVAELPAESAPVTLADAPAEEAEPPRRRHGGALPV